MMPYPRTNDAKKIVALMVDALEYIQKTDNITPDQIMEFVRINAPSRSIADATVLLLAFMVKQLAKED